MTDHQVDRHRLWGRLRSAVERHPEDLPSPVVVVDLDAFDANADDLVRRAAGTPIRVASTALRVPALLERALAHDGFRGVLALTLREALWLHEQSLSADVVVGYPTVDVAALTRLTQSPSSAAGITLMVDDVAQLDLVDSVRHSKAVQVRIAIDVDAGLVLGGQHVGPKRSPLQDPAAVVELARTVQTRAGFRLVGVMTYEGQVAGVPDEVPGQRAKGLLVRRLKQASLSHLAARRRELADRLEGIGDLEFWIGGGSGSVETSVADPVVTEVVAGSALLAPALLDHFHAFDPQPAAFFGLPVVRRPSPQLATVAGGGYIASGPPGHDRSPLPWAPPGLHLTGSEGAGGAQTPLAGHPAALLQVGDLVWFRHAKSGELFEHTPTVHLVRGDAIVGSVPTYRGEALVW